MSIAPLIQIKTAKHIAPAIFENKTPKFHPELLEFLAGGEKYKAVCMFRGGGKTTNVNKIGMFSYIFYDHERYIQIFSATQDKAIKFLGDVKSMLVSAMKKGYDIQKGAIWRDDAIEVIIDGKYKCYVEVFGAGQDPRGGSYEFARPTLQIFDDIESKSGTYAIRSKENRRKLAEWFWGDCVPSLGPTGRIIFIGTILHEDSLLNTILKDNKKWHTKIIPIVRDGKSAWEDRFPLTREKAREKEKEHFAKTGKIVEIESIEEIKSSWAKKGQLKLFYQEYLCMAQSEETKLFKEQYFKYFSHVEYDEKEFEYIDVSNALEAKRILIPKPKNIVLEDGSKIPIARTVRYATKDQASTKIAKTKKENDQSVIITCAYDENNNMYILDISAGSWTPFDKAVNIFRTFKTFLYSRLGIESGGMQNDFFYTIDEFQKKMNENIPVEPITHGGIPKNIRISNLEILFLAGKIFMNRSDPNTSKLEAQLLAFDIEVEGTYDDIIDTLAYQYFFIQGRTFEKDDYQEDEDSVW